MAETKTALNPPDRSMLIEWDNLANTDTDPAWISFSERSEMSVQLMEVVSGTPTVGWEWSLNLDADVTKVWALATTPGETTIALTVAGTGNTILQSGILGRPRVTAGTGVARVRLKANRIY